MVNEVLDALKDDSWEAIRTKLPSLKEMLNCYPRQLRREIKDAYWKAVEESRRQFKLCTKGGFSDKDLKILDMGKFEPVGEGDKRLIVRIERVSPLLIQLRAWKEGQSLKLFQINSPFVLNGRFYNLNFVCMTTH